MTKGTLEIELSGDPVDLNDLGTIVSKDWTPADQDAQVIVEEDLSVEAEKLILWLHPDTMDTLVRQASFKGESVEDYALQILIDSTVVQVGKATIFGPSNLSQHKVDGVITGPSAVSTVTRG